MVSWLSFFWLRLSASVDLCYADSQESTPTVRHHTSKRLRARPLPQVEQAEAAIQQGDYTTAQPLLEKAVAANPEDYLAWFDLGYVYKATNQLGKAIDAYRKSVRGQIRCFRIESKSRNSIGAAEQQR